MEETKHEAPSQQPCHINQGRSMAEAEAACGPQPAVDHVCTLLVKVWLRSKTCFHPRLQRAARSLVSCAIALECGCGMVGGV